MLEQLLLLDLSWKYHKVLDILEIPSLHRQFVVKLHSQIKNEHPWYTVTTFPAL